MVGQGFGRQVVEGGFHRADLEAPKEEADQDCPRENPCGQTPGLHCRVGIGPETSVSALLVMDSQNSQGETRSSFYKPPFSPRIFRIWGGVGVPELRKDLGAVGGL